jgi:methylthioribose-1-phosphate isomerase
LNTLRWVEGGSIEFIDQRLLPDKIKFIRTKTVEQTAHAIEQMVVRGAPAIGIAAAMGVALGALEFRGSDKKKFFAHINAAAERLAATRPTAVNLFWAIDRMKSVLNGNSGKPIESIRRVLVAEAKKIRAEDLASCKKIGDNGAALLKNGSRVLTHCNAGGLATAGYGTALGVVRSGFKAGRVAHVFIDETRPWLQGARLTAFEMCHEKIPSTLICDNMAASLMARGEIDTVVVGADRIAANGDVANKIGTYGLAVLARAHKIPFYVAAPVSTIDFSLGAGKDIVIEQRNENEVRRICGKTICPEGVNVINPAFDVTPARLVGAIVTEKGVLRPPYRKSIKAIGGR